MDGGLVAEHIALLARAGEARDDAVEVAQLALGMQVEHHRHLLAQHVGDLHAVVRAQQLDPVFGQAAQLIGPRHRTEQQHIIGQGGLDGYFAVRLGDGHRSLGEK